MIKRLFNGEINGITAAALLLAGSSLISRFLGILRDRILAGQFGAGDSLDVYYAAFRVPDLIFNLLVLGALSAGFIPVFTSLIKSPLQKIKDAFGGERRQAWELASNLLNILGATFLVLCGLGVIFAPRIMRLITPGFDLEKTALAADLTRIMFLSPIFLGVSAIFGGVLQSFKRFFVYSLSPIFYNIGIIIGALYLTPLQGIRGLAWGVVLGALLHLLVQLPALLSLGFKYRPVFNFKDKNIRAIGAMMLPRTMSLAVTQINLLVTTGFASVLASGSLAVFNLANNLQSFAVGIFGVSFAIAAFPAMVQLAGQNDKLAAGFSATARKILFFIIISTVLLITLRAQIIRVVLGSGQFGWQDTILTANALGIFAVSLFAQAVIPLQARVFYARRDSLTPFFIGIFTSALNVFLAWLLARPFGVAGLAAAFSASSIVYFVLLWIFLRLTVGGLDEKSVFLSIAKFCLAGLAAALTIQAIKYPAAMFVNMNKAWGVFTQGALAGLAGLAVYFLVCFLLKSEELFSFMEIIRRRSRFKKVETSDQGEVRGI